MEKINVIPRPNRVTYSGGTALPSAAEKVSTLIDSRLGNEGYSIRVESDCITVKAKTDAGFFYAEQTLNQLKLGGDLPCVEIEDEPRFAYRGFMLDSARHMQSVEEIKKIVDAAAMLKFNVFHWHLSDDQGFRIESERYPLLNTKGSWRESSDFGSNHVKERYGGFYTKEQIKDVVSYCKARFIDVVPEIDVPGHTTAIISSYPYLSCRKLPIPVKTKQGIFEDVLCPGDERTLSFVLDLIDEVLELFPSERFHIGGDETPKQRWSACPKCRAKMYQLSLKNEEELQGWFTCRVVEFLESKGKKVTVWNESLASGMLPAGVTAQRWMDKKENSVKWANRGNPIINSDFFHYYCDYPYHMTPLKKTYAYQPVPKGVAAIMEKHVIGVEVPIWTEYITDFDRLCYMIFPRFAAVAERGWTKERLCNCKDFEQRFAAVSPALEALGVKPAPQAVWNPSAAKRLSGTVNFFKDKIDLKALFNSAGTQKA